MARISHPSLQVYKLSELPLRQDIFMMDEIYLDDWEAEQVRRIGGELSVSPSAAGYVTPVHISGVTSAGADLSWYPNSHDRFHEVKTFLPANAFVFCAVTDDSDERPRLFVKSDWLDKLHVRSNSIFALVDAVDMTNAIRSGSITRDKVIGLRDGLDEVATRNPLISFISFADSLLLKTNWTAGMVNSGVTYTYAPEHLLVLFQELQKLYRATLGLDIYAVLAQGSNEYYDDPLLHISSSQNHISLNSLGLPFAQITLIERAARQAIRSGEHSPAEIYMDEDLFHSLAFKVSEHRVTWASAPYAAKLTPEPGRYFFGACEDFLSHMIQI